MVLTKNRVFRIPDDVYDKAKARAAREGVTLTAVVIAALRRYGSGASNPVRPKNRPAEQGLSRETGGEG